MYILTRCGVSQKREEIVVDGEASALRALNDPELFFGALVQRREVLTQRAAVRL
jgi:hypothetical protein